MTEEISVQLLDEFITVASELNTTNKPKPKLITAKNEDSQFLGKISQLDKGIKDIPDANIPTSVVHTGETDSSDDEDLKDPQHRKYNNFGRDIRILLANNPKTSNDSSLNHSWKTKTTHLNYAETKIHCDPIFGLRLVNPLISSVTLQERMNGRTAVFMSKIKQHVATLNPNEDWVFAGAIISKVVKKSQQGNLFSIWTVSDLHTELRTVALFLFTSAHKNLWKTPQGTVIGVLNPTIMDQQNKSTHQATFSVNNPDRVMILGQSKDLGICRSRKKSGDPCTAFVNKNHCEYCIYHVRSEYRKFSARSELQSSFIRGGFNYNLKNKMLTNTQGSQKLRNKDRSTLDVLAGNVRVNTNCNVRAKNLNKGVASKIDSTVSQRKKDLELLQKLHDSSMTGGKCQLNANSQFDRQLDCKNIFDTAGSSNVTLIESKNTALEVIAKLKAKKSTKTQLISGTTTSKLAPDANLFKKSANLQSSIDQSHPIRPQSNLPYKGVANKIDSTVSQRKKDLEPLQKLHDSPMTGDNSQLNANSQFDRQLDCKNIFDTAGSSNVTLIESKNTALEVIAKLKAKKSTKIQLISDKNTIISGTTTSKLAPDANVFKKSANLQSSIDQSTPNLPQSNLPYKGVANEIDSTVSQRKKDLEPLQKLHDSSMTGDNSHLNANLQFDRQIDCKNIFDTAGSSNVTLVESKNTALEVIAKLKAKKSTKTQSISDKNTIISGTTTSKLAPDANVFKKSANLQSSIDQSHPIRPQSNLPYKGVANKIDSTVSQRKKDLEPLQKLHDSPMTGGNSQLNAKSQFDRQIDCKNIFDTAGSSNVTLIESKNTALEVIGRLKAKKSTKTQLISDKNTIISGTTTSKLAPDANVFKKSANLQSSIDQSHSILPQSNLLYKGVANEIDSTVSQRKKDLEPLQKLHDSPMTGGNSQLNAKSQFDRQIDCKNIFDTAVSSKKANKSTKTQLISDKNTIISGTTTSKLAPDANLFKKSANLQSSIDQSHPILPQSNLLYKGVANEIDSTVSQRKKDLELLQKLHDSPMTVDNSHLNAANVNSQFDRQLDCQNIFDTAVPSKKANKSTKTQLISDKKINLDTRNSDSVKPTSDCTTSGTTISKLKSDANLFQKSASIDQFTLTKSTPNPPQNNLTFDTPRLSGKFVDLNAPASKTHMNRAKRNAIIYVQRNGPIAKVDPMNVKYKRKTPVHPDIISPAAKRLKEIEENEFMSQRFKRIMAASSRHSDLLERIDSDERETYFSKMEVKERMEEKMLGTFKVNCKAVRCLRCKYTSFSASDRCKADKHPLKVFDAVKRFFKCSYCGNRTVSLTVVPLENCARCSNGKWERCAMIAERNVKSLTELSIRGGEEHFVGGAVSNANVNLMVPDDGI